MIDQDSGNRFGRAHRSAARHFSALAGFLLALGALIVFTVSTSFAAGAPPTATNTPSRTATPAARASGSPSPAASPDRTLTQALSHLSPATYTATPTATPTWSPPLTKVAGVKGVKVEGDGETLALDVPLRSQYDQSPYQNANCGPTSLAMVLQAYGLDVPTARVRALANQLQGTYGYDQGIALDYLVEIGQQAGLRQEGLRGPDGHYRKWAVGDIVREVRAGNPVITLVHYTALPRHQHEVSSSDHYVVIVGVTDQGFLINDPASIGNDGYRQLLTPPQLIAAWNASSVPQQAAAFLPPTGPLALQPASGEANDGPGASKASPASAAAAVPASPSPAAPTATPLPTNTPEPTVNPMLIARVDTLKNWAHPTEIPTLQPATSPPAPKPTNLPVASPVHKAPTSPLSLLFVLAALSVGALGVIKSTGH
ncbi:MAG TPA: C39 family peptidase [Chloroflexota bacterium]|nr:C39 family peptidase [Chloroflexota bacterium]